MARQTSKNTKADLKASANEILKEAERLGVSSNYLFSTTFARYQVQLDLLGKLEKDIKAHGATVSKEYVKGRPNLTANPAITEYNRTASAANGTVSTLLKILAAAGGFKQDKAVDKLSALKAAVENGDE
jgi:hypothetical protein